MPGDGGRALAQPDRGDRPGAAGSGERVLHRPQHGVSSLYTTGSRLDALALDVYRLNGGGTEVFIQIAKTRADAVRCGQITRHRCTGQRFMDGNRFSMTTTPGVAQGIEVQHSPAGTYVITIAARNTTGGRPLELNNGDLIAVAQDPRLEPPPS